MEISKFLIKLACKIFRGVLGLLFLFYPAFSFASLKYNEVNLYTHPQWLKMYYYDQKFFGTESKIQNPEFFAASDLQRARTNPQYETAEFLKLFKSNDPSLCKFPLRTKFVSELLKLPPYSTGHCEEWNKFRARINLGSVSLVFSSYYVNTPASAFGHTLLKLNQKKVPGVPKSDLLDYGLNYAANVDVDNAVVYAFKGLLGQFTGTYTLIPYYYKIREYNDYESRDLWEYELVMTSEQLDNFERHVWELGSAKFRYYYIDENCSYQILNFLDLIYDQDLMTDLKTSVIPIDTVKVFKKYPGLLKPPVLRISQREKAELYRKRLNEKNLSLLKIITENPNQYEALTKVLSTEEKMNLLDAALELNDYLRPQDLMNKDGSISKEKQNLLSLRADIAQISPEITVSDLEKRDPTLSHPSERLGLQLATQKNYGNFLKLGYRHTLHDLLDKSQGQPPHTQIEFLNGEISFYEKTEKLKVNQLTLFQVTNIAPLNPYKNSMSWYGKLGAYETFKSGKNQFDHTLLKGGMMGGGITKEFFSIFGTSGLYLREDSKSEIQLGLKSFFHFDLGFLNQLFELNYTQNFYGSDFKNFDQWSISSETRFHVKNNLSINLKGLLIEKAQLVEAGIYYYY